MLLPPADSDAVRAQLDRIVGSPGFVRAERSRTLLRYLVERTLAGHGDRLKEYTVGVEALGRSETFDARTDPIVRAEASRLRERLARYYETDGRDDPLVLQLPKGSYIPRFEPRAAPVPAESTAESTQVADRRWRHPWLVGTVALLAGVAGTALFASLRAPASSLASASPMRLDVELRSGGTLGSEVGTDAVISADGSRIVFVARDSAGRASLYARRLDEPDARELPGTEGARVPFLSPNGQWVGFWAAGQVKRTSLTGGSPVVLMEATDLLGASWGEQGEIVLAVNPTERLWRLPEGGGTPVVVADFSRDKLTPAWPQLLPCGRAVVLTTLGVRGADEASVEGVLLATGERRVLVRGATFGRVLPSGELAYVNQGTLYVVAFDAERLEVTGTAVPVLDDVAYSRIFGYAQFDISRAGAVVYRRAGGSGASVVARVDRDGRGTVLLAAPGRYDFPRLSPDGRRIALSAVQSGTSGVLLGDANGDGMRLVGGRGSANGGIVWWPDSRGLLVGGRDGLAWLDLTRAGPPASLVARATIQIPWSLSHSAGGEMRVAYHELSPSTGFDLWTAPMIRTDSGLRMGTPEPFLASNAFEFFPAFSPDGRWIAYSSNVSGSYHVYVRRYPDDGRAVRVSRVAGSIPVWSPNGRELLYQTLDQRVMVASYRVAGGTFSVDAPRRWGDVVLADAGVLPSFDVAPDGEHLIALVPADPPAERPSPNHVTVLLNFGEEIRRRTRGPAGAASAP